MEELTERFGSLSVSLPQELRRALGHGVPYGEPAEAVLLHKGMMHGFPLSRLTELAEWEPVFQNAVFVLLVDRWQPAPRLGGLRSPLAWLGNQRALQPLKTYLGDIASGRFSGGRTVFIHIPKTAGTSIYEAARGHFHRSLLLGSHAELKSATEHLPAYDFVAGHFTYDVAKKAMPGANFATLLREPLSRLASAAGHARRVGSRSRAPGMNLLREKTLKEFIEMPYGRSALFMQNRFVAGISGPAPASRLAAALDRVAAGTVDGMPGFLARNRALLRIGPDEIARHNVTRDRNSLVPQEEIDEALAAHGDLIEEAGEIYRIVRSREIAAGSKRT
ncbi:hypothetical protein E3C22_06240 [Jiella endophytica]|uniref:Sulfotransferase family protein n=1 Tax=Jiella endophytica TaxID=2558362 RepID=A0A4Y8RPM3_9HYPH|nr:hypothetical protein [Jiella endophytica]TFF24980.1 hypothetical protein E3C22_06240 [Jiella endophytica]